jgi:KDO2-lipid IV(A) lauroyltransferase
VTRRALHLAEYLLLRLVELLLLGLPPRAALRAAEGVAGAWWFFDRRRRARVAENLRIALGEPSDPAARRSLVRAVFRQMLRVPVEVLYFRRVAATSRAVDRLGPVRGDWEALGRDLGAGRGGVLLSGHLGNWELPGRYLRLKGVPLRAVVRPIENPLVDGLAARSRGGPGRLIGKSGAVREIVRHLGSGGWIGMLIDQDAGRRGTFVPFFGLPASTRATPAVLALRLGVPVYVGTCLRRSGAGFRFEGRIARLAPPSGAARGPAAVGALLAEATSLLEGWVREAPDQYNWLHRRWKSRPAGEAPGTRIPAYAERLLKAAPPAGR